MLLVRKYVPPPTDAEIRAALAPSLGIMLSFGITSFTEAAAGYSSTVRKEVGAYAALADAGILKQRTRLCLSWAPGNAEAETMIEARNLFMRKRLAVDCVKIFRLRAHRFAYRRDARVRCRSRRRSQRQGERSGDASDQAGCPR